MSAAVSFMQYLLLFVWISYQHPTFAHWPQHVFIVYHQLLLTSVTVCCYCLVSVVGITLQLATQSCWNRIGH